MPSSPLRPGRPRAVPLLLAFLLLAGALCAARPARAADARPADIPLSSGKTVTGVVESADAKEVVVRLGPDEVRRVPWAQLAPLGVYRVKAALAPPADGEARLALAELAVELGLHAEARLEYEKALALGAIDPKTFEAVVARAETEAVEVGIEQALLAAEEGDLERALAVARDLKLVFGGAANAGQIDALVADLLKEVEGLQAEAARAASEFARIQVEAERTKEILTRKLRARAAIDEGKKAAQDAAAARGRGNVKARRLAEAADGKFLAARRELGRLRRLLAREEPAYREVLALLAELDRAHFDLLLGTARFFWDQRSYTRADEYAARASYIDPVHPDLLELRELLRTGRIRYRLSDVSNARPIVR